MRFGMVCLVCHSWECSIHFDVENGLYTALCLNCKNEEVVITVQDKAPKSKKELKKMRSIDAEMREKLTRRKETKVN